MVLKHPWQMVLEWKGWRGQWVSDYLLKNSREVVIGGPQVEVSFTLAWQREPWNRGFIWNNCVCVCVRVCVHLQETGGKALIHSISTATGSYVHDIMSVSTVNILKGNFKSQHWPRSMLLGTVSFTTSVEKEKCPSASISKCCFCWLCCPINWVGSLATASSLANGHSTLKK